jgi:ribosome maturation factor RimP
MAKNSKSVVDTVRELAEPIAESINCWVWDVEFVKEGARKILRITIDAEEGVDIDLCERMHRAIDTVLDEVDPIAEAYYLEISSPGIERELKTQEHIDACEGWDVEVKLYAPIDGLKVFRGVLLASEQDGEIRIDSNGCVKCFERSAVAKISTYFEF